MLEFFEGADLNVASAGLPGTEGRAIDPAMEAELPYEDEVALRHRSRVLTAEVLAAGDLVLTMEFGHHMRVLDKWPEGTSKVFGLRQFVDGLSRTTPRGSPLERIGQVREAAVPNSMMWDIADPYRRGRRAARRCADELDDLVLRLGIGLGYEPVPQD
jgi:protein-tyrosine phosphatase